MDLVNNGYSGLATPINLGLINNQKKYWASHFLSVIQCLRYHVNLSYPSRRFEKLGNPDWCLADLRADAPPNFFFNANRYLQNWGLQYFIVNFLNGYRGKPLVDDLISRLQTIYDVERPDWLVNRCFYMSGNDSQLSFELAKKFDSVFPQKILNHVPDKDRVIRNSDICLVLSDAVQDQKVGIFGEVEGVRGYKLSNSDYWDTTKYYSVFSLGVVTEKGNNIFAHEYIFNGVTRIVYKFQAEHHVVADFQYTLSWFENIFTYTPQHRTKCRDDDFDYLLSMLENNWRTPISQVIFLLRQFIDSDDTVTAFTGLTPIITSLQAN